MHTPGLPRPSEVEWGVPPAGAAFLRVAQEVALLTCDSPRPPQPRVSGLTAACEKGFRQGRMGHSLWLNLTLLSPGQGEKMLQGHWELAWGDPVAL